MQSAWPHRRPWRPSELSLARWHLDSGGCGPEAVNICDDLGEVKGRAEAMRKASPRGVQHTLPRSQTPGRLRSLRCTRLWVMRRTQDELFEGLSLVPKLRSRSPPPEAREAQDVFQDQQDIYGEALPSMPCPQRWSASDHRVLPAKARVLRVLIGANLLQEEDLWTLSCRGHGESGPPQDHVDALFAAKDVGEPGTGRLAMG